MWTEQIVLGLIGLSSGVAVAGGLFAFIVELGVVADLADRTHTAESLLLYEDSIALGGILGNAVFCFQIMIPCAGFILPFFGVLSGIFVGCWAMALAEFRFLSGESSWYAISSGLSSGLHLEKALEHVLDFCNDRS